MHFRGQTVKTQVAHVWNTIVQMLNLVPVVESKADHKKWSLETEYNNKESCVCSPSAAGSNMYIVHIR
jgi:hypothetical protein